MTFLQTPPELGNQYDDDRVLRSFLRRVLPDDVLRAIEPELRELGAWSGGEGYTLQLADRKNEPVHTPWDAWGRRIDAIEVTALWKQAARIAAEKGLVAAAYEKKHGAFSRVHQFALAYLFEPSSDVYTCPLAMTDGAAKTLLAHGNRALIDRAVPRLTSRDPEMAWTSGQWMTERTGGSDVGKSETEAIESADGWRLHGVKWFTSATTSPMALTLARPRGNAAGGKGLALFYLEVRNRDGSMNGIQIHRLKDKLGTRKVPTAELTLDGTLATLVAGTTDGVRNIAPMLNITRTWNSVCGVGGLRRAMALVRDFARRREAFGSTLSRKPLHLETVAGLQAEYEAAFHLAFAMVEWLGREENGALGESDQTLLRLLTPIGKLTTGRMAVHVATEAVESFGGAGYVEDTGLPRLLRDAQVLSIWEGTTNVLSLDALKVLAKGDALQRWQFEIESLTRDVRDDALRSLVSVAAGATRDAGAFLRTAAESDLQLAEAGARHVAMTLGRSLALALLVRHAQWSLDTERDGRSRLAAIRFARNGINVLPPRSASLADTAALAMDEPTPV